MTTAPPGNAAESWFDRLEKYLHARFKAIRKARATTADNRTKLIKAFADNISADTSLVLFGSIAREEMTSGSDTDWILLVDGQAIPEHVDQKHAIAAKLVKLRYLKPGQSGVFACIVGSHDIVHEIGGEDDTNSNTTRRVLLLLESFPVGKREAYDRVRKQILNRYLRDDRGLTHASGEVRVPRFLLNDFTRYWRTVTVDFVYKQRAEAGKKRALRNAKLRMSRKLVFASGLLRCFFCHLDPEADNARQALHDQEPDVTKLLDYMERELGRTPLELLARAASRRDIQKTTAEKLFSSYDCFLAVLDDSEKRKMLEEMTEAGMATSAVWKEISDLSHSFDIGLRELFFGKDEDLSKLTTRYGVF